MRMRSIILSSVVCPSLSHFSTLFHIRHGLRGNKYLLNIKPCVLIFSTTLVWNISHFKKSSATFCHKCDVFIKKKKYPLLSSDFNKTWIFSMGFRKTLKTSNFTKAVQWKPSCSLRADGRTDTTQLVIAIKTDQLVPWRKPIAVQNSFAVCAQQAEPGGTSSDRWTSKGFKTHWACSPDCCFPSPARWRSHCCHNSALPSPYRLCLLIFIYTSRFLPLHEKWIPFFRFFEELNSLCIYVYFTIPRHFVLHEFLLNLIVTSVYHCYAHNALY